VEYGAFNPVTYFSVDGSPVAARRTIVQMTNCNTCHVALSEHGTLAKQRGILRDVPQTRRTRMPAPGRPRRSPRTQPAPPQGINFNLLVHRIHDGVNVTANGGKPFIVVGHGGKP